MNRTIFDYCLQPDGCFTVPIDYLSNTGIDQNFAQYLIDNAVWTAVNIDLFNQAFALYFQRARQLYAQARGFWFPPRIQHICIVTDSDQIRPYFQPFNKNSWLLYQSDFELDSSSLEFAVYQFLHLERMWLLQQIDPVLYANFSYFLTLEDTPIQDFIGGCRKTNRPDAAGFLALAEAMPSIRKMYHQQLKKPVSVVRNVRVMQDTGLIIPAAVYPALAQCQQKWSHTVAAAINTFRDQHNKASSHCGQTIRRWLVDNHPPLLITGDKGRILWEPGNAEHTDTLQATLHGVTEAAEPDILRDLQTIAFHSQRFLSCLRSPAELSKPADFITEDGLCYIHKQQQLIAYNIGSDRHAARLWQPAPPYERLMLAARTVHEWGHLVAESGWVIIPAARQAERQALEHALVTLFDQIHAEASPAVQKNAAAEVTRLKAETGSLGQTLLQRMLVRIEDYMANLVAYRFLSADEMDTYVRNNVHSHLQSYSTEGVYMQLIRLAYEFQYLRLSRIADPFDWFYKSTWFGEYFIDHGVISKTRFEQLLETVQGICDCYELDAGKFDFEALATNQ